MVASTMHLDDMTRPPLAICGCTTARTNIPGLSRRSGLSRFTRTFAVLDRASDALDEAQLRAFTDDDFPFFDRVRRPDVTYAGMLQYDGDLLIPERFLVAPPAISNTMGEYLARNKITQFACSETQKFGHVTYFWNGNRTGMFDEKYEEYVEIPSDVVPFEQRPWMKAAEITDATIAALRRGGLRHGRINYANGDMVGHTGHLDAAVIAVVVPGLTKDLPRRHANDENRE